MAPAIGDTSHRAALEGTGMARAARQAGM